MDDFVISNLSVAPSRAQSVENVQEPKKLERKYSTINLDVDLADLQDEINLKIKTERKVNEKILGAYDAKIATVDATNSGKLLENAPKKNSFEFHFERMEIGGDKNFMVIGSNYPKELKKIQDLVKSFKDDAHIDAGWKVRVNKECELKFLEKFYKVSDDKATETSDEIWLDDRKEVEKPEGGKEVIFDPFAPYGDLAKKLVLLELERIYVSLSELAWQNSILFEGLNYGNIDNIESLDFSEFGKATINFKRVSQYFDNIRPYVNIQNLEAVPSFGTKFRWELSLESVLAGLVSEKKLSEDEKNALLQRITSEQNKVLADEFGAIFFSNEVDRQNFKNQINDVLLSQKNIDDLKEFLALAVVVNRYFCPDDDKIKCDNFTNLSELCYSLSGSIYQVLLYGRTESFGCKIIPEIPFNQKDLDVPFIEIDQSFQYLQIIRGKMMQIFGLNMFQDVTFVSKYSGLALHKIVNGPKNTQDDSKDILEKYRDAVKEYLPAVVKNIIGCIDTPTSDDMRQLRDEYQNAHNLVPKEQQAREILKTRFESLDKFCQSLAEKVIAGEAPENLSSLLLDKLKDLKIGANDSQNIEFLVNAVLKNVCFPLGLIKKLRDNLDSVKQPFPQLDESDFVDPVEHISIALLFKSVQIFQKFLDKWDAMNKNFAEGQETESSYWSNEEVSDDYDEQSSYYSGSESVSKSSESYSYTYETSSEIEGESFSPGSSDADSESF